MIKEFEEKDWKLFRKKIVVWQENYMDKLNQEYIQLLNQDKSASDKFWELNKKINQDKRKPGVVVEMKRSVMMRNILELLNDGVIVEEDLDEFSDTFKETLHMYTRFR